MTIRYEANPPKILSDVDTNESIQRFVEKIKKMALEPDKSQNPSKHNTPGRHESYNPKTRIDIAPLIHPTDPAMPQDEKRVSHIRS